MKKLLAFIYFISIMGQPFAQASASQYTHAMLMRALKEESTSPLFVLITVHDLRTQGSQLVCIQAPFLLRALEIEHGLLNEQNRDNIALKTSMAQRDNTFSFSNKDALENVRPRYTAKQLQEVRRQFPRVSARVLKEQLREHDSPLQQIYIRKVGQARLSYRDALAHILLESGIVVGVDDRTGMLFSP